MGDIYAREKHCKQISIIKINSSSLNFHKIVLGNITRPLKRMYLNQF